LPTCVVSAETNTYAAYLHSLTPLMQVMIEHKKYHINNPFRKCTVKHLSYPAIIKDFGESQCHRRLIVNTNSRLIRKEICSLKENTIILAKKENLTSFSWDTVFNELCAKCPTLDKLMSGLIKSELKKPLVSLCHQ